MQVNGTKSIQNFDQSWQYIPITGYAVTAWNQQMIVHKDDTQWIVTDCTTGSKAAVGETKKGAIIRLRETESDISVETYNHCVKNILFRQGKIKEAEESISFAFGMVRNRETTNPGNREPLTTCEQCGKDYFSKYRECPECNNIPF